MLLKLQRGNKLLHCWAAGWWVGWWVIRFMHINLMPSPCNEPMRQMAEILMEKLPGIYHQYFLKEGVVHAIDQLAAIEPVEAAAPQAAAAAAAAPSPEASSAAAARAGSARRSGGRPASRAADKDAGEVIVPRSEARLPAGDALRAAVGQRARLFHAQYFSDGKGAPSL